MDNRPIGVFDSGLGGLTVVRELLDLLPNERIIYLGDTGRVPYGSRSRATILKYARQDIDFLTTFDIKAIMVACGTVSTTVLDLVQSEYDLPILGVAEAASKAAAKATRNHKIGLIGTQASIRSGTYERIIRKENPLAQIYSVPCPLFVPLVENGHYSKGDPLVELTAQEYLTELKNIGIDTLILGCTHYPLLSDAISAFLGPEVTLISTGAQGALHLKQKLTEHHALASERPGHAADCYYYVTDSTDHFSRLATIFLGRAVKGFVEQVSIDESC